MLYTNIDFNYKNILITGGAGFIGSNLAFYFQKNYPNANVVVFDKFRSGRTLSNGNLESFGHFKNLLGFLGIVISGDINSKDDLENLEKSYRFDYIFHEAAISDTTVNEQDLMISTNVNAYENLLKIAVKHGANMIYASSAATYGDSDRFEVGYESPNNVYGFSKLMMDNITNKYIKDNTGISIVGLRYFNVYGGREFYFVYIEDVIQANIKACNPKKSGIYNVGTGKSRSFQDISDIVQFELGTNYTTEYVPNPFVGQYQFFTQANIETTREFLNYEPKFTLEDGVKAYMPEIKRIYKAEVQKWLILEKFQKY